MQKAIIIGATSSMGRELARRFAVDNYRVGIIGRRTKLLDELARTNPEAFISCPHDITAANTTEILSALADQLGGLDLLVIAAAYGKPYEQLNNQTSRKVIDTNILSFTRIAEWGIAYFIRQKSGHLVSFSSIAGIRGSGIDPAYCASNAFKINYMEGMRQVIDSAGVPVFITDVRPGFVEKPDTLVESRYWILPLDKASRKIYNGILRKKKIIYVSKRWAMLASVMPVVPGMIYQKFMSRFVKSNGYGKSEKWVEAEKMA